MTKLSWLHLSDWHQRGSEFDRQVVRDKLLDDIRDRAKIAPELADIRLVVFSGDIAFTGRQVEYEATKAFLLEPMRALLGIEPTDFFLVPGNHDLDREAVKNYAPAVLQHPLSDADTKKFLTDAKMRGRMLDPFADFCQFAATYSGQADAGYASQRVIELHGKRIALLGLNSALMCGRRFDAKAEVDDLGVLTIGEPQVHDPLRAIEGADLRICVLHHPFEWLHEHERSPVEGALKRQADIILTGHTHRPGITLEQGPRGSTLQIPAGASYDRRESPGGMAYANAYNFVTLDLATGKGTIHLRRWDGQNSCWTEDHATAKQGRFDFTVPRLVPARGTRKQRAKAQPPPAVRRETAVATYRQILLKSCDLMETAGLPSDHLVAQRELHLRQLFIPTRLKVEPAPGKEEGEAAGAEAPAETESRGSRLLFRSNSADLFSITPDEPRQTAAVAQDETGPRRVAPGECLQRSPRLVILGNPGSGKTTFTRWLAMACLQQMTGDPAADALADIASLPAWKLEPILLRCRDLEPGDEKRPLAELLQRCYRADAIGDQERSHLGEHLAAAVTEGRAALIIDGLDEIAKVTSRSALCDRLLQIARDHEALPIVVTSRVVGYREVGGRLRQKFTHGEVDDLLPEEKDQFAAAWCALTEPPERQMPAAQDLIHDLHGNERIERLTGTPIMLTTMALVRRAIGQLPQRRVELYPKAIEVLLNWRSAVDQPLDPWEARPQLAYLAYTMCEMGVARLDERGVLNALEAMRAAFPNLTEIKRSSPREFLRKVEARTALLIQTGHERLSGEAVPVYEFRHLSFQEYLAAWAMVHGYERGYDPTRRLADRVAIVAPLAVKRRQIWQETPGYDASSSWSEVVRLCIADCRHEDVDPCLGVLLAPQDDRDATVSRRVLAALCLADEPRNVSPGTADEILAHVARTVSGGPYVSSLGSDEGTSAKRAVTMLAASRWWRRALDVVFVQASEGQVDLEKAQVVVALILQARSMEFADCMTACATDESESLVFATLAMMTGYIGTHWARETALDQSMPESAGNANPLEFARSALTRPSHATRSFAARALGQLGDEADLPALIARLQEDAGPVRQAAAEALGRLAAAAAAPALIARLQEDPDADVRQAAAKSLGRLADVVAAKGFGKLSDVAAMPALLACLQDDPDVSVRRAAAGALGALRGSAAVPALLAGLQDDPEEGVRQAAARALGLVGDAVAAPALVLRLQDDASEYVKTAVAEALGELGAAVAVPALIALLEGDAEEEVRQAAAIALGKLGDAGAVPALIARLRHERWHARRDAAEALGSLGGTAAVPALIACLEDDDEDVRRAAAIALGQLGDAAAAPALAQRLQDDDWRARQAAAEALGGLGDAAAVPALIACVEDGDNDVRQAAVKALGRLGDPAALPALIACLEDPDEDLRQAAAEALGNLGDTTAVPLLIDRLDADADEKRKAIIALALAELGDMAAVPALTRYLDHEEPMLKLAVAMALACLGAAITAVPLIHSVDQYEPDGKTITALLLGYSGDLVALPTLIACLDTDEDPNVQAGAALALGWLGSAKAVPSLIRRLPTGADEDVRTTAAQALGRLRDASAVPALIERLRQDDNAEVRRAATEALGNLGDEAAVPHLIGLFANVDEDLRLAAAEAIGALGDPALVPELRLGLESETQPRVVWTIAGAMARLGDASALAHLQAALDRDPDPHAMLAAAAVLGRLDLPGADAAMVAALAHPANAVDPVAAFARATDRREAVLLSENGDGAKPYRKPGTRLSKFEMFAAVGSGLTLAETKAFFRRMAPFFRFRLGPDTAAGAPN